MKKNLIYKKAAIRIVDNCDKFCCHALNYNRYELGEFTSIFNPQKFDMFNGSDGWFGSCLKPENQLARSLALLFMYEMGE
jgi:hypothetical protein